MNRKAMRRGKDRRMFNRSASRSKLVNLNPTLMRGGIRL